MSSEQENPSAESSKSAKTVIPDAKTFLKKPVVLIAGAGIGGLTTALLCERAGIEFFIFERAAKVKPLGSAMSCSPNVLPFFEQLGLIDEIKEFSFPIDSMDMYEESLKRIGSIDGKSFNEMPDFHNMLLSKIPPSRVFMGKKIMSIQQNANGVMIRCVDNTSYHGDILVGADGAYSAVRQNLYKQMGEKGLLPKEDRGEMPIVLLSMVGTTKSLDPTKYPVLNDPRCHFSTVLAKDKPITWTTITLPHNKIAWGVGVQLSVQASKELMFRNSEWGPDANSSLVEEVYHYPMKHGGVLGELIDATDKDLISQVYVEEKLFKNWNYGRTALIGDAVHKMSPSAGQGAVSAMQDAVILVNCIYEMEEVNYENIQAALADYRAQRFHHAEFQVNLGKTLGGILFGQRWYERFMRKLIYNMPKWAQHKNHLTMATYRPMISFLPPVPNRTNIKLLPQKPSRRYAKEQAALANAASAI
ncbi:hypothetical protein BGZ82_001400 [Podila clonocystis]|nr:hypothetical protein BGZ82_001400 [Podila clonocystis]